MTHVFLTIDTELSPALHQRGVSPEDNFSSSILGALAGAEWGVRYQIRRLNAHGLKAVFFVEALFAHVMGIGFLRRIVDPILEGGHEVQLHIHTEWLRWLVDNPLGSRTGWCMADFSFDEQRVLLELGIEALMAAGAPRASAFRAGNFGANNATLRAAAGLGLTYDSSYNRAYVGGACRIVAEPTLVDVTLMDGVVELPVSGFLDFGTHYRPAQLCANSIQELKLVIDQSLARKRHAVVIVSHSFELLNRARNRVNRLLVRRFDALCALLATRQHQAPAAVFGEFKLHSSLPPVPAGAPLRSTPLRTAWRMAEQALGTVLYER